MNRVEHNAEDTSLIYHLNGTLVAPNQNVETPALNPQNGPTGPPTPLNKKSEDSLQESNYSSSSSEEEARTTADDEKPDFPEGGLRAWSVVAGSFCGLFAVFGIINSTAVFQEYFSKNQLSDYSPSQVGWIFSLSLFLTFFCGLPVGPIFDAHGPRLLTFCGSILLVASMMLLGLCTSKWLLLIARGTTLLFGVAANKLAEYWHFFIVYSLLNGLGGALINTPALASIAHFFLLKRGHATGLVMTSGSLGGIIFPLMLQRLIPRVGFAWATRILASILLFLLIFANLLTRSRLPLKTPPPSILPTLAPFKSAPFALATAGIFLLEWGLFVPLAYISSYALAHGSSLGWSFQILALLNAGSFVGRLSAGWIADRLGRFNTLILCVALCILTTLALWLPARDSQPLLIAYALLFGCASGSNLSLAPVCVGQLCETENYGRFYATAWMVVSFGTLTGVPIAGQILEAGGGAYGGLIVFAGAAYAGAFVCFGAARTIAVGWGVWSVY
ncbi:hypothetical protein MMC12_005579 [Toensbergia leucococca]|nr:hypothetical protein [Toensbergia leucococca]